MMKWTLYKQYAKGRYLGGVKSSGERRHLKPIAIPGVSLASDPVENPIKLMAWQGARLCEELWWPVFSIQAYGIRISGIEQWKTARGDMATRQVWWLVPLKEQP